MGSDLNFGRSRRLPVVRAVETTECGLACLAMVARYHGHDIDLNGLRQRFALSMSGATLKSLMQIAEPLGLATRALRIELEDLGTITTPCVLHWDLSHFVVLKAVVGNKVTIHDPALGMRTYTVDQVSRHFTGVALELTPIADFKPVSARTPVKLSMLWSRMSGFWPAVGQVAGLSLALQLAALALPFQLQLVVDEGIYKGDGNLLAVLAVGFAGVVLIHTLIDALRSWTLQVFSQSLAFQMVGNVVHHLLRLPGDFFEKRHVGDLISRIGSATAIQEVLTRGLTASIIDGLMVLIALVIMAIYSPLLTYVVVFSTVIIFITSLILFPPLRLRMEEQVVERAREQTYLMETVRAATVIKLMGRETERESGWRNLFAGTINAGVSVAKFNISLSAVQNAVVGVQTVLVIYLGAQAVIGGDGFSVGMLFAFLAFRQIFADRTNALITQSLQLRSISLHLERLADIVQAPADQIEHLNRSDVRGDLSLVDVSFRYGSSDAAVFTKLNIRVSPGEFVAITGPSGGGKSTLIKVMLGLYSPCDGQVQLDGLSATPSLWRWWRERAGVVAQDDRLLSGTLADNIAFFDPNLDMARVHQAATAAQIHEEILQKPMGYLSLVGDMGSALSGGQRQRVLLARALYREPAVLYLDEGTANLDEGTEEVIAEIIANLPITRIVVAHRPALLRRAGRVLEMKGGILKERHSNSAAKI